MESNNDIVNNVEEDEINDISENQEDNIDDIQESEDKSNDDKIINNIKDNQSIININTINKFIGENNIEMNITCLSYSDFSLPYEKIIDVLNKKSKHGLTGLKNISNTAYMNAVIHCLSHTPEFVYFYICDIYTKYLKKKSNPNKSNSFILSNSLSSLLKSLWIESERVYTPTNFRYNIIDLNHLYNTSNHQDAEEFLYFLFDKLQEENLSIKNNNSELNLKYLNSCYYEPPKTDNESDLLASQRFWNFYKFSHNNFITEMFYGQLKSMNKCLSCAYSKTVFEVFSILPLDIPILQKVNVILVPKNNIKETISLTMFVSQRALFIDIGTYFKQYISYGFEAYKILYVNYVNSSCKFVKMSENIYNTSKKGIIIIYEIDDTADEQSNAEEDEESEGYFPFITIIRNSLDDLLIDTKKNINNDNNKENKKGRAKYSSYPRIIPISTYSKIKTLRYKIFGYLLKYYPIPSELYNNDNYNNLIKNYNETYSDIEDHILNDIYLKAYNEVFNNKDKYKDYLSKFPFEVYLTSPKPGDPEKLIFSNNPEEYQNEYKDNQSIKNIIDLAKRHYKVSIIIKDENILKQFNKISSIEATADKKITLNDCLIDFTLYEKMEKENEWYCPRCNRLVNAYKKTDIFYIPKYLIITLKRFKETLLSKNKIQIVKNTELVEFPINTMNFEKYIIGPKIPKPIYELYSVIQHSGSLEGGHYISACKNSKKWYIFDDASVFECDDDLVCSQEGYILFYKKKNK